MNYTKNHHLPQWVKDDRIMMDDFNDAMSNLESSLNANAQTAAAAQSAANSARSAASSAQSTANSALSSKPYVIGHYTGTNADITINVGFRPSFVIIYGQKAASHTQVSNYAYYNCTTAGTGVISYSIKFTSSGFQVFGNTGSMPDLSDSGRTYEYIAFK